MIVSIYTLADPNSGQVRYVGQTRDPQQRFTQHLSERSHDGGRQKWLNALIEENQLPLMTVVCEVPIEYANQVEAALIRAYRLACPDLLNGVDGARGGGVITRKIKRPLTSRAIAFRDIRHKLSLSPNGIVVWRDTGLPFHSSQLDDDTTKR